MLQKRNQHHIDAKRVQSFHLITEVLLVPSFEEETKLYEADIISTISAYELRIQDL